MGIKGFLIDKSNEHNLSIIKVHFDNFEKVEIMTLESSLTAFEKIRFFFDKEKKDMLNKCDLIALRDFLNDILKEK